jgi:hypothetical protein
MTCDEFLDNDYFINLVGPPGDLGKGPDWIQNGVSSGKYQWVPAAKESVQHFTLNADMALVLGLCLGLLHAHFDFLLLLCAPWQKLYPRQGYTGEIILNGWKISEL